MSTIGNAASKAGKGIKGVFAKVNPDVWREVMFVSMSSYSYLLPKRERVIDRGADGHTPVVLVHGLGGNRGAWLPLRLFLRINGHRRVYAFGYEEGTVPEHAASLKEFIKQVKRCTGEKQVDIVAHSLGGIVSRYAIQRLGMAGTVRTLITLATPHQGTYAAHYANTVLTRALRPESELMQDLNADDLRKLPTRLISLYSDRDVYVVPGKMMSHPGTENLLVENVSHSQYLVEPRVFRVVCSRLERSRSK